MHSTAEARDQITAATVRPWPFVFGATLLVTAGLFWLHGQNRSLWLDDFHSLFHARAPWGEFLQQVRQDNHPPLYFVLLKCTRALFGEGSWALRGPALILGLLTVGLTAWIGRRDSFGAAAPWAGMLLGVSTLFLTVSTEARMYSGLALCVTGLLFAGLCILRQDRGHVLAAVCSVLGLHMHYTFGQYFLWIGAFLLIATVARRRSLKPFLVPLAVTAVLCMPWYLWGFKHQLLESELAPGVSSPSVLNLVEAYLHLIYFKLSVAPEALKPLWLAGGGVMLVLAGFNLLLLLRRGREDLAPRLLVALVAFGVPAWNCALAMRFPRAGFNWTYQVGSAPALCLIVCALCTPRSIVFWGRGVVFATAGLLAVLVARSPGSEDFEQGVITAHEQRQPGEAVTVWEIGPPGYPHDLGWSYYVERLPGLSALDGPAWVEGDAEHLRQRLRAGGYPGLIVFQRNWGIPPAIDEVARSFFATEETWRYGYSVYVRAYR